MSGCVPIAMMIQRVLNEKIRKSSMRLERAVGWSPLI